jgi:lipopolysaccharide transport system permease protein
MMEIGDLEPKATISTGVSSESPTVLPKEPIVVIEPSSSWPSLGLNDIWQFRELLYFLTWRDVKVRYKQTLLGAAWAILQPLLTMLIFTLIFGRLAGIKSDGIPYPVFAYGGLLVWTFFSNAVTNSGNSLVGSANLITKIYFPRMLIPGASVGAGLVDFGIAFLVLLGLLIYYRIPVGLEVLMVLPLLVLSTLLALGVGMWLSALNVKFRDVRYAIPFLIQLWLFASPVIYPASMLQGRMRWLLMVNPVSGIIENFRTALFGQLTGREFDWSALGISALLTVAILFYSAYSFRRMERTFADIV